MQHDRASAARSVALVLLLALACCAWLAAGAAAAGPAALPAAVKSSFPLGVSGLAVNKDGSRTLWVLSTQRQRVVVAGSSIFSIIDVVFRVSPGHKLAITAGRNCTLMPAGDAGGGSSIECLPSVEPNRLVPVVTFTSSPPYPPPPAASPLVELNSSSRITVAPDVALPATARTPAAIRSYLAAYAARLHLRSTIVYVTAGKPTENAFTLSTRTLPRGWVTFVVTNRGREHHAFVVCPNGGLLDNCLASSQGGVSFAQEYDNTGALTQGKTGFFSMNFTSPGTYEYLSDLPGQAAAGAKGDLVVR